MPALNSRTPLPDYHPQGGLRTINFTVDRSTSDVSLGFNIRGGAEFGLGIFVSGVTEGSIAEGAGFVVGDEIISINGTSFEGFAHEEAVDFITSHERLSVTVRSTGRIPDEDQLIGKHNWIELNGERKADNPQPDYIYATEDLYPSEAYYGTDDSLKGVEESNRDFPIVYQEKNKIPGHLNRNREPPKSIVSSQNSSQDNMKRGSKKSIKKNSKKRNNAGVVNANLHDVAYERDQLVNAVIDKIQIDFTINECGMIRQSMAMYHDGESVEDLLNHILGLFTPRKFELLREIRKVIYADEVERYDAIVSSYLQKMIEQTKKRELEALENKAYEPEVEVATVKPPVDEVIMQPVKSSYLTKDARSKPKTKPKPVTESAMVVKSVPAAPKPEKEPAPKPAVEPIATMVLVPGPKAVEGQPKIVPFVPFTPEPYVLYDKDKNPVQKLAHGVRVSRTSSTEVKETPSVVSPEVVSAPVPVVTAPKPVSPPPAPVEPVPPPPEPIKEPVVTISKSTERVPTKKVIKVETQEVHKVGRKESIEVLKKGGKDNRVVSVTKTSGEPVGPNLLTIENSSFDEASNTITIDATLNMDKSAHKINAKTVESESVDGNVPYSIEIVEQPSPLLELIPVVEEPVPSTVKPVEVTVERSPPDVPVVRTSVKRVEARGSAKKDSAPSVKTYNIDKSHKLIGLSISGGVDSRYQREIRIVSVNPVSASANAGLKVGQELLSIDDNSLTDKTHEDACRLIRSTYRDKANNTMVLTVQ